MTDDAAAFPPPLAHGPLDGVKVLDLSEDIAGSFCARLLADYGGEVLKLEPPAGAALRRMPPFFGDDPHPEKSLFFLALNLNKKGATLNLETEAGRALFRELVPHVDVVIESYRPGYLTGLGLGYDALEAINPGLVLTSITPFGQTGPYSQYSGEEIVSYAMGMIMSISGLQGREPLKHGGFQAQYEGGLNGAAATAMALFMQGNTGEGQHIDVSVTECVASTMMATQTMYPFTGATQPRRRSEGSNFGHPMPCEDGWIMSISGLQDREPLKHGGFQAQYEGGLNGAAATAMALFMQGNTGEGQHIDVSVTECVASTMMATQTMYPFTGATQPRRRSEGSNFGHPMPCEDGWIIAQTGGGATWETIANFFGAPELHEPRFGDAGERTRNGEELDRIVIDSISERGKWELFTQAAQSRMLFGIVQTPSELANCPQLESRDFYREVEHPVIGRIKVPAALFNLSLTPYQYVGPAPTLGQHNREIYVDGLGYSPQEYVVLRQTDAI